MEAAEFILVLYIDELSQVELPLCTTLRITEGKS